MILNTTPEKEGKLIKELLKFNVDLFFSDVLSQIYDLGYEELSKQELTDRDAWFTKKFIDWARKKCLDSKVLIINSEDKGIHIVPYIMGFTVDFTYKHLLEKDQEEYTISTIGDYIILGYNENEMNLFNEFPQWIKSFLPPKSS